MSWLDEVLFLISLRGSLIGLRRLASLIHKLVFDLISWKIMCWMFRDFVRLHHYHLNPLVSPRCYLRIRLTILWCLPSLLFLWNLILILLWGEGM